MTPNEILRSIAESFQKSSSEILLTVVLFVSFIGIISLLFILRRQYEKGKLRTILKDRYAALIVQYSLTIQEQELIEDMSRHLNTPEKKYLLFTNEHVFNNCLFELKKHRNVNKQVLDSLLVKLQFKLFEQYHLPRTSREFLPEKHFMLVYGNKQKVKCLVDAQTQDSLTAVADPDSPLPGIGESVSIYTYNALGIIHFPSVVQDKKANVLKLAHSDSLEALQRRQYFRKEVQMPIYIHSESSADPPQPSVILDLSAGGMSVENPDKKFKKGDDVKITMHGKNTMGFDLYGEVVRTSKKGETAHIVFGHFSSAQKDDIIRFLNTKVNSEPK
ncbi:MAG: PilZ domain-containing protein [Spirochaetales bacterium]|nr:PilZ domain-containing protein [Spirochaetales bacterium]